MLQIGLSCLLWAICCTSDGPPTISICDRPGCGCITISDMPPTIETLIIKSTDTMKLESVETRYHHDASITVIDQRDSAEPDDFCVEGVNIIVGKTERDTHYCDSQSSTTPFSSSESDFTSTRESDDIASSSHLSFYTETRGTSSNVSIYTTTVNVPTSTTDVPTSATTTTATTVINITTDVTNVPTSATHVPTPRPTNVTSAPYTITSSMTTEVNVVNVKTTEPLSLEVTILLVITPLMFLMVTIIISLLCCKGCGCSTTFTSPLAQNPSSIPVTPLSPVQSPDMMGQEDNDPAPGSGLIEPLEPEQIVSSLSSTPILHPTVPRRSARIKNRAES